ncbi:MAG: HigA family addiction module antidote protein [Clostridiales bacterium]|nr:HigA family addiction module antidote protein [Clostridiales bacterium]
MKIDKYKKYGETKVPAARISQILKGNQRITADTALRFSKYFGNSADFWLGIQDEYDLRELNRKIASELEKKQDLLCHLTPCQEDGHNGNGQPD